MSTLFNSVRHAISWLRSNGAVEDIASDLRVMRLKRVSPTPYVECMNHEAIRLLKDNGWEVQNPQPRAPRGWNPGGVVRVDGGLVEHAVDMNRPPDIVVGQERMIWNEQNAMWARVPEPAAPQDDQIARLNAAFGQPLGRVLVADNVNHDERAAPGMADPHADQPF